MTTATDSIIGVLHQSTPTANIYLDKDAKLLEIEWLGKVGSHDYQKTMMEARNLVGDGYSQVIINRMRLEEINPDSALWLKKEFIKVHLKPVIHNLKKVATVESKSAFSRFYSNSLTLAVKVIYPSLSIKSFPSKDDALEWMGII
ncbi:MAG: STAS/SEC14 domain-containing protein [Cyclobacteriaceae bacterium]